MNYKERKTKEWLKNKNKAKKDFKRYTRKKVIKKIKKDWEKRHLEKTNHNLDFSTLLTDIHNTIIKEKYENQNFYDWVIIGYYYAVYHSALALLARQGYKSKSHLATICGLILFYFHKKDLDEKDIRILSKITPQDINNIIETQNLRERASYGTSVSFEKSLTKIARKDALNFINKAKNILNKNK